MTGIILSITDGTCLVVGSSGEMRKVKTKPSYQVGDEITVTSQGKTTIAFRSVMTSAAALALIVLAGWFSVGSPFFIDPSPNIELTLNNFDRVLHVRGLNENGENLLTNVEISGLTVPQALAAISAEAVKGDQLANSGGGISVTVVATGNGATEGLSQLDTATSLDALPASYPL